MFKLLVRLLVFCVITSVTRSVYSQDGLADTSGTGLGCIMSSHPQVRDLFLRNHRQPTDLDEELQMKLNEICPGSVAEFGVGQVCCDMATVDYMSEYMGMIHSMAGRENCPICNYNLARIFCQLHCSPRQAAAVRSPGDNGTVIEYMQIHVDREYMAGTFWSCEGVELGKVAADMCGGGTGQGGGSLEEECTPESWLNAISANMPYSAFANLEWLAVSRGQEGGFNSDQGGVVPLGGRVFPCNESIAEYSLNACTCQHCKC